MAAWCLGGHRFELFGGLNIFSSLDYNIFKISSIITMFVVAVVFYFYFLILAD